MRYFWIVSSFCANISMLRFSSRIMSSSSILLDICTAKKEHQKKRLFVVELGKGNVQVGTRKLRGGPFIITDIVLAQPIFQCDGDVLDPGPMLARERKSNLESEWF